MFVIFKKLENIQWKTISSLVIFHLYQDLLSCVFWFLHQYWFKLRNYFKYTNERNIGEIKENLIKYIGARTMKEQKNTQTYVENHKSCLKIIIDVWYYLSLHSFSGSSAFRLDCNLNHQRYNIFGRTHQGKLEILSALFFEQYLIAIYLLTKDCKRGVL